MADDSSSSLYYTYDIYISNNMNQYYENLTTSDYIFMKYEKGGTDYTYDIEFSLTLFYEKKDIINEFIPPIRIKFRFWLYLPPWTGVFET